MQQFVFFCPHHHADEVLEVADDLQYWEGEMNCTPAPGETGQPLKVRVVRGLLIDAEAPKGFQA